MLSKEGRIKKQLSQPIGRIIYRICKNLSIPPEKLRDFSEEQIDWLIENIIQDDIEQNERTRDFYEAIKPWMNHSLWLDEQKQTKGESKKMVSESFQDELAKHGVSSKDIDDMESKMEKEINGG